jgi:all-beta uncharacterized protein/beta-propeller repeat-containing protein
MKTRFLIALTGLVSSALAGVPQDAVRMLDTAPLRFESDAGSVPGHFVARGTRFHFEFSKNQAVLRTANKAVSLQFQGANKQARMEGDDLLRSKTNLFLGSDPHRWRSAIANYGRLQVRGLYPGIDLVYYGNAGELEYDLRMRPGADPRQVRLRLQGDNARLNRDGSLVAELIQKPPVAYQIDQNGARVPVASRYRRNRDGSYGFALGAYDHRRELVIDPVITLSLYLAGSSEDIAYAIGHDTIGFLYVGGETFSTDFPVTSNATQATLAGGSDLFMAKIDPHAAPGSQIVYATYIGGSLNETFGGMAVGPNGDVYLTGSTISTDFPTVNPYQSSLTNAPNTNAFVVWINSSQGLAYSSYIGGSSIDNGNAIAYDSSGNIWVVGAAQSTDFPNLGGIQSGNAGTSDMFIAGFAPSQTGTNTCFYASYLGGSGFDTGRGVAVAADGTLWVVGGTYSVDIPITSNAEQHNYRGGGDAYIAHINPTLGPNGVLYATYLGASSLEEARSVVLDPAGPVIVSGYTVSPDFEVTSNALQPVYGGNTDAFISILNPASTPQLVYSTYFGGANGDVAFDLKRDANGILYLTGMTLSPGLPVTAGALQAAYDGSMDVFVLKLNPARAGTAGIDYLSYLGSDGLQIGYGVDFDQLGNIFVVGSTSGPLLYAQGGVSRTSPAGTTNGFLLGFGGCTFSISTLSEEFPPQGGSATIGITAQQQDCSWTASSSLSFVTVSPTAGNGNGSVTVTVAPNNTGASRQGTITIAGVGFLVGQGPQSSELPHGDTRGR